MTAISLCRRILKAAAIIVAATDGAAAQSSVCQQLEGAVVATEEGIYLGRISNRYDGDSIFNKYGVYGSKYSGESIWNKYGEYGGRYGQHSPFNRYGTPPLIIQDKSVIAYLSADKSIQGAIDPVLLALVCYDLDDYADLRP